MGRKRLTLFAHHSFVFLCTITAEGAISVGTIASIYARIGETFININFAIGSVISRSAIAVIHIWFRNFIAGARTARIDTVINHYNNNI